MYIYIYVCVHIYVTRAAGTFWSVCADNLPQVMPLQTHTHTHTFAHTHTHTGGRDVVECVCR